MLQRIDYRIEQVPWEQRRIAVGGRLLVYVIDAGDDMPVADWLDAALVRGVGERDAEGFNRFRLVLATGRPQALRAVAEPIFHNAHCRDEKTHLHVVDAAGVALF